MAGFFNTIRIPNQYEYTNRGNSHLYIRKGFVIGSAYEIKGIFTGNTGGIEACFVADTETGDCFYRDRDFYLGGNLALSGAV